MHTPHAAPSPFVAAARVLALLGSGCCLSLPASADLADSLVPTALFVQAGAAEQAQMLVAGASWDWQWRRAWAGGELSGYGELSFGRWNSDSAGSSSAWVTQLGVTPVLRWWPDDAARWFLELGIGANVLAPVYRSGDKRFSTTFNFGDHLALGWRFGERQAHELVLRLQHFSNAGIKHPNPGEDFLQLRYVRRF